MDATRIPINTDNSNALTVAVECSVSAHCISICCKEKHYDRQYLKAVAFKLIFISP